MQDKEFDELFRSKLENFEPEPAEHLWQGIDASLQAKRRRAFLVPVLRIAAILLIVVSAGWFFAEHHPIQNGGKKPQKIAAGYHKRVQQSPAVQQIAHIQTKPKLKLLEDDQQESTKEGNLPPKIALAGITPQTKSIQPEIPVAAQQVTDVTLADVSPPIEIKPHVVPDKDVPLRINSPEEQVVAKADIKKMALAQLPAGNDEQNKSVGKHRSKHGLGDLVNLVADRFNKSRAAIISNDDDDESVIGEVSKGIKKMRKGQ